MPRGTKRVKVDHETKAAYAASQPLFDALRFAVDRMSQQHAYLINARAAVQQTHVKLADSLSNGDTSPHAQYIGSVIKAWRSVTESYAQIFSELARTTGPKPSEGRPMQEGHETFVRIAGMAADASHVTESLLSCEERQGGQSGRNGQDNSDEESEWVSDALDDEAHEHVRVPSSATVQVQSGITKFDSKEAKRKKKINEVREEHKKKILALRANMRNSKGPAGRVGSKGPGFTEEDTPSVPGAANVEYEDVSAEVEARLKAKQAKKEVAKKMKKRKRDSDESHGVDMQGEEVVEKPLAKRSRPESIGDNVKIVATKEKRKKIGCVDGGDDRGQSEKRKRAKTKG